MFLFYFLSRGCALHRYICCLEGGAVVRICHGCMEFLVDELSSDKFLSENTCLGCSGVVPPLVISTACQM